MSKSKNNYIYNNDDILKKTSQEVLNIIGIELKRRRQQKSKTLTSVDCQCSISYLSKIENGKIRPKYHVLKELCDVNGITNEEIDSLISVDDIINKCLISLFVGDGDYLMEASLKFKSFNNYKTKIIEMLYLLIQNDFVLLEEYYNSICEVIGNLNSFDGNVLRFIKMRINNYKHEYIATYNDYFAFEYEASEYLSALIYRAFYEAICKSGIDNPLPYYQTLCHKYLHLFNSQLSEIKCLLVEALIKQGACLPAKVLESISNDLQLLYFIKQNDYSKLLEILEAGSLEADKRFVILVVLNRYEEARKAYNLVNLASLPSLNLIIINYLHKLISSSSAEVASYIINVAIPFAKVNNDFVLFYHFLAKLSEISLECGKYKSVAKINLEYFQMVANKRVCMP